MLDFTQMIDLKEIVCWEKLAMSWKLYTKNQGVG